MPTSMPISAPSTNSSYLAVTAAPSSFVPSTGPSISREPSVQFSQAHSRRNQTILHILPWSVPTLATDPPSIQPSGGPSAFPSLADQLSDSPSGVPTSSPAESPSIIPNESNECRSGKLSSRSIDYAYILIEAHQINQAERSK